MIEHTVSPERAKKIVTTMIKMKKPVFLHGSPGIGKSDVIRQIGKDLGREVYDIRLLLMTEVDIRGIPYYNAASNTMEWAPPSCFPLDEDSDAIIFLDEITQASPSVQAAALQLVLDRQIGDFKLPENVAIVAAGNRQADKTGAKPLIKALANRFIHVNYELKFKDWQAYAIANNVHPQVVGFLSHKPNLLNNFDASNPDNAFATPRSWVHFVSDLLNSNEVDDDILSDIIAGSVGQAVALEFMSVRELLTELPNPDDILAGKVKSLKHKTIAAQYSLVTSVTYRLKELQSEVDNKTLDQDVWYEMADNFLQFANEHLEPEVIVLAISISISQMKLRFNHVKMPSYREFFSKYKNLLKGVY